MARPIQIDRDRALKNAKAMFWQRGYANTSMSDLLQATGMGAGSFYAAFENKAHLFELAVDEYNKNFSCLLRRIRERHRGLEVIHQFLLETLVQIRGDVRRRGCLLVNSVLELEAVEPALHRYVLAALRELETEIYRSLVEARELGQLRFDLEVVEAKDLLLSLLQGIRVESRRGLSRKDARRRVTHIMMLFEHPQETITHDR